MGGGNVKAQTPPVPIPTYDEADELIASTFKTRYGRAAKDAEAEKYRQQLTSGSLTTRAFEKEIGESEEAKRWKTESKKIPRGEAVTAVRGLYMNELQREENQITEPEVQGWVDQLTSGKMTMEDVKRAFQGSEEYKNQPLVRPKKEIPAPERPEAPTFEDPSIALAAAKEREVVRKRKGRSSTILTSGLGVIDSGVELLGRPTLLGGGR
jgi:hypothetical protein